LNSDPAKMHLTPSNTLIYWMINGPAEVVSYVITLRYIGSSHAANSQTKKETLLFLSFAACLGFSVHLMIADGCCLGELHPQVSTPNFCELSNHQAGQAMDVREATGFPHHTMKL